MTDRQSDTQTADTHIDSTELIAIHIDRS